MIKINEIKADFWEHLHHNRYDAICCTTNQVVKGNGELVMGAGIAKQFAQRFPGLPQDWGDRRKKSQNNFTQNIKRNPVPIMVTLGNDIYHNFDYIVAIDTKKHWKEPSDLNFISHSLTMLFLTMEIMGWNSVLMPKPGCSNGGLSWENEVRPMIEKAEKYHYYIEKITFISKG